MNVVLSIVAQLLHIAVIVIAAPLLTGLAGTIGGYLSGQAVPPILRPVHDIVRLFRKQPIRTQAVSVLTRVAPLLSAVLAALIAVFDQANAPPNGTAISSGHFIDRKLKMIRQPANFFLRDPHKPRRARAAVAALGAGELQAVRIPGSFFGGKHF